MSFGLSLVLVIMVAVIGLGLSVLLALITESEIVVTIGVVVTLIATALTSIATYGTSAGYATFTITKQERVVNSTGKGARYLIYTPNEVFEDTDTVAFGKFNSSDLYGQLTPGKKYGCKVAGWRVPVWSSYRNLISCQQI